MQFAFTAFGRWLGILLLVGILTTVPLHAAPFPIATNAGDVFEGSAAFDGTNYLVALGGSPMNHFGYTAISAQMISATGTLVGNRILLGHTGGNAATAFDGTNYLMVWEDAVGAPNNQLYAQFIAKSGAKVGTPFPVTSGAGKKTGESSTPLIFTGSRYFTIWLGNYDTNGDAHDIYGQYIDKSGILVGSQITLVQDTAVLDEPAMCATPNGANILITWLKRETGAKELYDVNGLLLTSAGTKSAVMQISQTASPSYNPMSIACDGANFFIVWSFDTGAGYPSPQAWDLHGRFMTTTGTFPGNEFRVSGPAAERNWPSVTFNGKVYLLTWIQGDFATSFDFHGGYYTTAGTQSGSDFSIMSSAFGSSIAGGNGVFLATMNGTVVTAGQASPTAGILGVFLLPPSSGAQPDLAIRNANETSFTGVGLFNGDGTNQTKSQTVMHGATATACLQLKNAGTTADTFTVSSSTLLSGWTANYSNASGKAIDLSSATFPLAAGATTMFTVRVTPGQALAASATNILTFTAASVTDHTKIDVVKAVTTVTNSTHCGDWWMFHHDLQHTSRSAFTCPSSPALKWTFATGNNIFSAPSMAVDGTIYFGSYDNNLYALNPNGTKKWAFTTGGQIESTPAIGADGTIYVESDNIYAINPDGTRKWVFTSAYGGSSSPAIASDGTIYIGSNDDCLYALNPNGTNKWTFHTTDSVESSPAVGADGTIYVGAADHHFYAINPDGSPKWSFLSAGLVSSSPSIGVDGTIYLWQEDGKLYAFNSDGSVKWTCAGITSSNNWYSLAIGADGTIYSGSTDGSLYAINPNGTKKWAFSPFAPGGTYFAANPVIGADGTIYISLAFGNKSTGVYYGSQYAVNPNGTQKWAFASGGWFPSIGADGTIYAGSTDGKLYAIGTGTNYTVTPAAGANGMISPNTPQQVQTSGSVTFLATANAGYTVDNWQLDSATTQTGGALYTLKSITANHAVKVTFKLISTPSRRGDWWMFHHDPQHTGRSPFTVPAPAVQQWSFATGQVSYGIQSSAALGQDGTIYVGSDDDHLYAVNPDGSKKWAFATNGYVTASPAIGTDGTIYLESWDGYLYALNPDGTQKWKMNIDSDGIDSSPTIGTDGTIYFGTFDKHLYAVNPNGTIKWMATLPEMVWGSSPAIGADGTIYIESGTHNDTQSHLIAVNPNGGVLWALSTGTYQVKSAFGSSPAIGADRTIYVGSIDGNLYAVNPNGTKKWTFSTGGQVNSSPAIGTDGTVYFGSNDGNLYAVTSNGTKKWAISRLGGMSSAAIGVDGTLYIGEYYGNLDAVNPNGTRLWACSTGASIMASPAIGAAGTIYIGTNDGILHAIGSPPVKTYTITPTAGANGVISPNTPQTVSSGANLTFIATANAGYTTTVWKLDGASAQTGGTQFTLKNITANHAVNVAFTALTFTVTPTAGSNGVISPKTPQIITYGGSVTFTASANAGYTTDSWYLDGATTAAQVGGTTYTVKTLSANHAVKVTFKVIPPVYQPDLLIRTPNESAYTGGGIFNLDGTNQTKSQWLSDGMTTIYCFRLQNAGNTTDTFTLTAPAGGSGWTLAYFDMDTITAITTAITGQGWKVARLAPGTKKGFYVQVTPGLTVPFGATNTLTVTVVSTADATKKDVVKALSIAGDVAIRVK